MKYHQDREVGLGAGSDQEPELDARWIGERLLFLDELEETLDLERGLGGSDPERIHTLERRVHTEKDRIQALEARGSLQYDEISRVMEQIDLSG